MRRGLSRGSQRTIATDWTTPRSISIHSPPRIGPAVRQAVAASRSRIQAARAGLSLAEARSVSGDSSRSGSGATANRAYAPPRD